MHFGQLSDLWLIYLNWLDYRDVYGLPHIADNAVTIPDFFLTVLWRKKKIGNQFWRSPHFLF